MTIKVNGQDREVADGTTVTALIEQHNLSPQKVAVELNRRLIRSDKYDTVLKAGDEVEIVTFVGGGGVKAVLNVGGRSKGIPIPPWYAGWRHDLLDIDPRGGADIVMDARDLLNHTAGVYDAIYCGHNLEHYHRHDGAKVLRGFHHVLKPDGFVEIRVPNLGHLFQEVVQRNLDIDDVFYVSASGPILVRDMIYGLPRRDRALGTGLLQPQDRLHRQIAAEVRRRTSGFPHTSSAHPQPEELVGFFFKQCRHRRVDLLRMIGVLAGVNRHRISVDGRLPHQGFRGPQPPVRRHGQVRRLRADAAGARRQRLPGRDRRGAARAAGRQAGPVAARFSRPATAT